MRLSTKLLVVSALLSGLLASPADAQQNNVTGAAKIAVATQPLGTTNVTGTANATGKGAVCTFNQVSHSGTPSTTISIQMQDSVSGTWQSMATSGAITADATPTSVMVYPGSVATSVPTGMVIAGLHLPAAWRVQQIIGGSAGSTLRGSVGCDLLQ